MQHVFIVGSKGIPGAYGGYETFVDKLTEYHQNSLNIKYHVACKNIEKDEFEYHNVHCFKVKVQNIGPAQAILYDIAALKICCDYIRDNHIQHPVVYILACRIGPFAAHFQKVIHKLGGIVYLNPDGHEWLRAKWSVPVRRYWKISERMMVKHVDLLICDSTNIENYIKDRYIQYRPNTTFIPYGAELKPSGLTDNDKQFLKWLKGNKLSVHNYYLAVGRFVPENNYEIMIKEFMSSSTKKDFAIITTSNDTFLEQLNHNLHFRNDRRIKFVGTMYDKELLKKIRENAYGYLHGHEVGGTNPSLLEALSSTKLNLLLDVGFNREVGENAALYWNKDHGNLASLINKAEHLSENDIEQMGIQAKERINNAYNWKHIADLYKDIFLNVKKNRDDVINKIE